MALILVGYKLFDETLQVAGEFGGLESPIYSPPNPLDLPNGSQVLAPAVGEIYEGFRLLEWLEEAPETVIPPPTLVQIMAGILTNQEGELIGLDRIQQIAGGFADGDTAYLYFLEEQPDLDYIVTPSDGVTKYTDHVEITRPGLSTFSFVIERVQ